VVVAALGISGAVRAPVVSQKVGREIRQEPWYAVGGVLLGIAPWLPAFVPV